MRADRLLSLLILLQTRGKLSAQRLAAELEVSERTIYRDVEALSLAGVPVYAERGPGGGINLLDSYRTTLTGLNADEVRALFMLNIPAPLAQLGVEPELKTALLKLAAALPETQRRSREQARQRVHLDATWWFQGGVVVPHLQTIQQALWEDRKLRLVYRTYFGAEVENLVAPYGLVAKASDWHLVAEREGALRVYRVTSVKRAEILAESFTRRADFDLADYWKRWCEEYEKGRNLYWVTARIAPDLARDLHLYFGDQAEAILAQAGPPDESGWVVVRLPFDWHGAARERLLGFGRAAQVLDPEPLRLSVIDFARQVLDFYNGHTKM
jgi:predicted DNA-binding transcriptional regulator YafY